MFWNCYLLEKAPCILGEPSYTDCLINMFYTCSNLSSIAVGFTNWNNTNNWVGAVGSNGIFYKPTQLEEKNGNNYIPSNWTVVNI